MSEPIANFYRGDSRSIRVTLVVDGVAEPQAGNTLSLVLRAKGGTATPALTKSLVVPAGAEATAGRAVIPLLPAETSTIPAGGYELFLVRITPSGDRWTFHKQDITVLQGAMA